MNKDTKESRKAQYVEKRKTLISLSQTIRLMVKEGVYDTVNDGLREFYTEQNPEIKEFNTFNQWREQNCTVKKGSKAYLFWGQPRRVEQVPEGSTEPEEFKYWPICYLFANTQVHDKNEPGPEPTTAREPAQIEQFEDSLL